MTTTLHIELTSPQSVNGKRAPYQSLWLLVRLHYAQRFEAASGVIRLAELRQQFTDARSLRMFISRAFKDFAHWSVQVGWGEDAGGDPRFLNQDKRSQGPFWLPASESERISCTVEGTPATQAELLSFLGMKRKPDAPAYAVRMPLPADFWTVMAAAQQNLRQGRLLAMLDNCGNITGKPGVPQAGALAAFKEASSLAGNRLQRALAALGEAQVWRRLDDLDAARKTLMQLRRVLKEGGADEGGYLDAMEQILTAWCAYSERDFTLTEALLVAMHHAEPRAAVVRHHPRIRFEWHNLMALLKRARALNATEDFLQRRTNAMEAMQHFAAALDAAFEFGSFDAAQQVAANVGMATWLFACEGVTDEDAASMRPEALRWLLLSEWLCRCAGLVGRSVWNAIYLMRIARGNTAQMERPSLAAFRILKPMQPAEMLAQTSHLPLANAEPLLPTTWRALAEQLLARQRHGESRYSALQRCGLWLEHAWFAAHEGDLPAAAQSLALLDDELPHLPASDKAFFHAARHCLPTELVGGRIASIANARKLA